MSVLRIAATLSAILACTYAQAEPDRSSNEQIKEMMQLRDPFRIPELVQNRMSKPASGLELIPLDQVLLQGVLKGQGKNRAVLVDLQGRSHVVSEGGRLGMRGGVVRRITPNAIHVLEKVENPLGEIEDYWTVIKLGEKASAESQSEMQ